MAARDTPRCRLRDHRLSASAVVLVSLVAGALVIGGCGSGKDPTAGGARGQSAPSPIPTGAPATTSVPPSDGSVTPDPLTSAPPPGAVAVPAAQVDTAGLPAGFPRLVWTASADGRAVGVYGRAGGCIEARLEVTEQSAGRVALRVVQFRTGPGPCTRELRYPPLAASLAAPLGTRRVVLTGVAA